MSVSAGAPDDPTVCASIAGFAGTKVAARTGSGYAEGILPRGV